MKLMQLSQKQISEFTLALFKFYEIHKRELPWRQPSSDGSFDAYKILVSEFMLQQTQVTRVIPKYEAFLNAFPSLRSLAQAPLGEVLRLWSGLGYNRRAKYLHESVKALCDTSQPWTVEDLAACKGIGLNTAKAVVVYSYNQPQVFIETNIRSVLIHHFLKNRQKVPDAALTDLLQQIVPRQNAREFYWAMMDYGSMLKRTYGNAAQKSAHYRRQTAFHGSRRQIRGAVMRSLASRPLTQEALMASIEDERLPEALNELSDEGLIIEEGSLYKLP